MSHWECASHPSSFGRIWRFRLELLVLEMHEMPEGCYAYVRRPDSQGEVLASSSRLQALEEARIVAVKLATQQLLQTVAAGFVALEPLLQLPVQVPRASLTAEKQARVDADKLQIDAAVAAGVDFHDACARVAAGEIFAEQSSEPAVATPERNRSDGTL